MASVPAQVARLLKGTFTSDEPVEGWRHFHVIAVQRRDGAWCAELAASCDAARRVWVPASRLLRQEGWRAGWTPLREL